ncbi:hypothetical protein F4809DRAFT_642288 [Biscogniauxia mediterranea]|nr:hypothetical protein F4809DRAFT_642288 [Biscogniauxia mediterranea]
MDATNAVRVPWINDLTFLPQESDLMHQDWESLSSEDVTSIWLFFRPGRDERLSTMGWSIGLATRKVFILLYAQKDTAPGDINFICRPLTTRHHQLFGTAHVHMESETTERWSRPAIPGTKVEDILKDIDNCGITAYRTHEDRGYRFWISMALYQMSKFILEPLPHNKLPQMSLRLIQKCEQVATETVEIIPLQMGYPVIRFWKREALDSWKQCIDDYWLLCLSLH